MYKSNLSETVFKKFRDVAKILLVQSQIFGLVTFGYNEKKFQASRIRIIYSLLAIAVYTSLTVLGIYNYSIIGDNPPPIIYKTTDILTLIVTWCYVCTMWSCAISKREKLMKFLLKLMNFDGKLQTSNIIINYEENKKRILLRTLMRYVILLSLIAFLLTYVLLNIKFHEIVAEGLSYFLMIINSVACHQITEVVLMIKARFVILNRQLNELVAYFIKNNVNTIEKQVKTQLSRLSKICTLHHQLTKLIKLFNDIYGLVLLFMFGVSFVSIVLSLFYCAAELQSSYIKWPRLLWAFISCLNYMLDTIYVCHVCYETIEEAKKAGELIHKIETQDHDVRDEIEMFSLQIANEQVEFNAAGFFPVNFTLLFSIIGGVTTYIIILIQLSATLSDNT